MMNQEREGSSHEDLQHMAEKGSSQPEEKELLLKP
jgi:hypothetical protein